MVTCNECNKKFKIKLNSKFGIKLKEGYQTTCPYCGFIIYLSDIDQVRWFLTWARMLPTFVMFIIGINMNTILLDLQELLIAVGVGVVVFMFVIHRLTLLIAGKMYDKLRT